MIQALRLTSGFLAGITTGNAWATGDPYHYIPAIALLAIVIGVTVASFVREFKSINSSGLDGSDTKS